MTEEKKALEDLLSPEQEEYDRDPALREVLAQAMKSSTVRRKREFRSAEHLNLVDDGTEDGMGWADA